MKFQEKGFELALDLEGFTDVTARNRGDFFNVQGTRDFPAQLRFQQLQVDV